MFHPSILEIVLSVGQLVLLNWKESAVFRWGVACLQHHQWAFSPKCRILLIMCWQTQLKLTERIQMNNWFGFDVGLADMSTITHVPLLSEDVCCSENFIPFTKIPIKSFSLRLFRKIIFNYFVIFFVMLHVCRCFYWCFYFCLSVWKRWSHWQQIGVPSKKINKKKSET